MITDVYSHVSEYKAMVFLKLTMLQKYILDAYIQNWIAGNLIAYDPENSENKLFYFNCGFWAQKWKMSKQRVHAAVLSLIKPIKTTDDIYIQIFFGKRTGGKGIYIGMSLDVLHTLISDNYEFFNSQCVFHRRPELQYYPGGIEQNMKDGGTKIIIEPMFQIEDKTKNKKWQLDLIRDICMLAVEKNTILNDNHIFRSHLDEDGQLIMTKAIDRACEHLQAIYNGSFLREPNLFGSLGEDTLEIKRAREAVKKLRACVGNIEKVYAFVYRCAFYYLDACEQGMDCAQPLKKNWPEKIDEFFIKKFYKTGDHVAYFLLHRFKPETNATGEAIKIMENCGLSDSMINTFNSYGADYIVGYLNSTGVNTKKYWQNIKVLVDEYHKLKDTNKTSYSINSFFGFILEEVGKVAEYRGELYPDVFSLASSSVKQVMRVIRDK